MCFLFKLTEEGREGERGEIGEGFLEKVFEWTLEEEKRHGANGCTNAALGQVLWSSGCP